MSYTPGTKLSHTDSTRSATVLTGDNVMVTAGLGYGQMMKLADWLILADGARIQEEYIPLPKEGPAHNASGAEYMPVPKNEAARNASGAEYIPLSSTPAPPPAPSSSLPTAEARAQANLAHAGAMWAAAYAAPMVSVVQQNPAVIGAKFRWTLNNETYRVAIMTAKGVLQVKSVIDGAGDVHPTTCPCTPCRELAMTPPAPWARRPLTKTMFADEAAWRASLPAGGTVELSLPGKLAEAQKADAVYKGLSDVEKVKALLERYKIRTQAWESGSHADTMRHSYERIQSLRNQLAAITLQEDMSYPLTRRWLDLALKRAMRQYGPAKLYCDQDPVKGAQRPVHIQHRGSGKIRAMIGGEFMILTVFQEKIAATAELHRWGAVKLYKNFAEMGNPKLSVSYRRRTIDV
jgi:hypothetical protein